MQEEMSLGPRASDVALRGAAAGRMWVLRERRVCGAWAGGAIRRRVACSDGAADVLAAQVLRARERGVGERGARETGYTEYAGR